MTETGEGATCSPYAAHASSVERITAFEIPEALRRIASWDVTVTVRGYGSHAPLGRPHETTPAIFWCHGYRRRTARNGPGAPDAAESLQLSFGGKIRHAISSGWRRLTSRKNVRSQ